MLGSLNRWLRICGYETKFFRDSQDEELIEMAKEGGGILLTRDQELSRKSLRAGVTVFMVTGEGDVDSLAEVAREFNLELDPKMARCTLCGGQLMPVSDDEVEGEVPDKSLKAYDRFWRCQSCGKVYWRGSHWGMIVKTVSEASRLAKEPASVVEETL